jgi:hypothetical protein
LSGSVVVGLNVFFNAEDAEGTEKKREKRSEERDVG